MLDTTYEPLTEAPTVPDARQLRGMLAEARISHLAFARACGLSRVHMSGILCERLQPGELSRIKIAWGLARYGLLDAGTAVRHG